MDKYLYTFVTNPDDPSVNLTLKDLDSMNGYKLINSIDLDRGLIMYELEITDNKNDIIDKIAEISYVPIISSINKSNLPMDPRSIVKASYIEGVREIYAALINYIFYSDIKDRTSNPNISANVEITEYKDEIILDPISYIGSPVYENPLYIEDFINKYDMNKYIGYQILSLDSLTRFALETWYKKNEYVPSDINPIYLLEGKNNLVLFPVGRNTYEQDNFNSIRNRLDGYIISLRRDGHFTFDLSIHDLENIELIKELSLLWNIDIVYENNFFNNIVLKTNVNFGISPEKWLTINVEKIKAGNIPTFNVSGVWQYYYFNDYERIYGKYLKSIYIKYGAYLSYSKLALEHDNVFIQSFTKNISVADDLSINVDLPNYNLVKKFKEYLLMEFSGSHESVSNFEGFSIWVTEPCINLEEGVVKRWIVQQIDPSAQPMIFKNEEDENEILIFRSPLSINYPSPFVFTKDKIDKGKETLLKSFQSFYSDCHDSFEPILRDKIDELSLHDMMRIISIQENNIKYCFAQSTLEKLDKPIHPLSRNPLSEKTISMIKNLNDGLRGLFDVGELLGLYPDIPHKTLVKPNLGVTYVERISTDSLMRDLVGNLFQVMVEFKDGTTSHLFKISLSPVNLSEIDELKRYVNRLWSKGFFLNYWNSAVEKYLTLSDNKIKSYSVIVINKILNHAGDSLTDGGIALEYLHRMYEM